MPPTKQKKKEEISNLPVPPSLDDISKSDLRRPNFFSSSSPPRTGETNTEKNSNLPPVLPSPPPAFPENLLVRPPIPESPLKSPFSDNSYLYKENITSEILEELRNSDFGSAFLEAVPKEPHPPKETMKEITEQYQNACKDYLAAGEKHLEMNFLINASLNYSCAILCRFLGNDVFEASHLMAELAGMLPKSITESFIFQGTKLLLKAYLVKNASFAIQAEKWLRKDEEHFYKEDKELIEHAINITRIKVGI
ncbi:MAG: hypothetical protein EAX86_08025 [Candidatus Heimdallarchaeota archaeon]|nr:hypothetical protein [Candidatus Heimdallarchaeota archaeon]